MTYQAEQNHHDKQLADHLDSFKEDGAFKFKCEECLESKPFREMRYTHDHKEEGCCNDCSLIPFIAQQWGFDNA